MKTAMDCLPEDMRRLIEMRFVHHLDYEDIADKTGLSPGNVRVRISRAKTRWVKVNILADDNNDLKIGLRCSFNCVVKNYHFFIGRRLVKYLYVNSYKERPSSL